MISARSQRSLKPLCLLMTPTFFYLAETFNEVENQFNKELITLTEWVSNLLSLNIEKTSFIVFSNKRNINMSIFLSGIEMNRVSDTKFLGVIILSNLTWNKHIDVVHSKISKTIGILCKVRH